MAATYLVTGCAGFLGSNLVGRMLAAGHEVVGVDNLSMGLADNLAEFRGNRSFRFIEADVTDAPSSAASTARSRRSFTSRRSRSRATARRSTR